MAHSAKSDKGGNEDLLHPDAHDIKKHIRTYLLVFAALAVGTIVTVLISYVHIGAADSQTGNIVVALVIATLKALLVAGFFMHLLQEKWTIYKFLIVTAIFVIGLFFLTWLAWIDPVKL